MTVGAPDSRAFAGLPASPVDGWIWQPVCESGALAEGGLGVRFEWPAASAAPAGPGAGAPVAVRANPRGPQPAFVVRYDGEPCAYLNRCAHVPVELDWDPGRFFDDAALYLVCATHGALYDPQTGVCVGGPCRGQRLAELEVIEHGGWVWVLARPMLTEAK